MPVTVCCRARSASGGAVPHTERSVGGVHFVPRVRGPEARSRQLHERGTSGGGIVGEFDLAPLQERAQPHRRKREEHETDVRTETGLLHDAQARAHRVSDAQRRQLAAALGAPTLPGLFERELVGARDGLRIQHPPIARPRALADAQMIERKRGVPALRHVLREAEAAIAVDLEIVVAARREAAGQTDE